MSRAFKNITFPGMAKEKQLQMRSADPIGRLELQTLLETLPLLIMVYRLALFQEIAELKKTNKQKHEIVAT